MTQDVKWRVGDITTDGLLSGQPTWSIGSEETLEFFVAEEAVDKRPVHDRAYEFTYGGELPGTYGGKVPSTFNVGTFPTKSGTVSRDDAYLNPWESPYGKLREYTRYAGSSSIGMSIDGVPLVRETVPVRSNIESFIVDIAPVGADVEWVEGAWVLIVDATDTSEVADHDAWLTIELEVVVLAPLTDYATRDEVERDMAPPIIPDDSEEEV